MMLEAQGQQVELAGNGKEGVGMYQKNCKGYKCILMDFHMPEVDGFQATKQIRTFEKYVGFNVPIIGLTGDDIRMDPQLEENAKKVGMNSVITKPIDMGTLAQLVS
jgi:CheY-like chemotaxis protein